ncbi:MAG: hypothetical protein JJU27_01660 [Gammaproteobacteria bacterium]|nr:hypothetical protein [Gammaproteobacteria bacterium]
MNHGDRDRLPRQSKGRRPHFFDDPAVDQLYAVVIEIAAELSVAYERIDTLERLLDKDNLVSRARIESFEADEQIESERMRRREAYLERIFRVFAQDAETSGDPPPGS